MPRPRTAAGDSSLSSSTTRVSAVRRVRRVQPLLSLLLSSSLLLLLNLLCGQVHCDPRIPRSERAALAAHELGAHIRELRQRIDASNDPTEKSILRSVLEAEFNHVNFQRANVLQQDQLKQRLAPSSAPHSQRTADTHDGVFSGAVDDADTLRPVVFVHIPKTGGRRFRDILESLLGQSRPAMVERDLVHKAVVENDFSFVHNQSWFYVHFDSAVLPTFLDILRVQGKLPRIVTFLRDPVQRLVSEYYSYGSELSLDEYARQLEARNRQALFLVGKGDQQVDDSSPSNPLGSTADAFDGHELVTQAIKTLRNNGALVGFVECYSASVMGILRDLGLDASVVDGNFSAEMERFSAPRDKQWDPSNSTLMRLLKRAVVLDRVLYDTFFHERTSYCSAQ